MNTQPEALRLADWIESDEPPTNEATCAHVAAELRRQHEEIKCEERRFSDLWEHFAALDKKNQELERSSKERLDRLFKLDLLNEDLVEALEEVVAYCEEHGHSWSVLVEAKAALAKARGTE